MSDFWKSLRLCCLWYYRKHDSFSFSIWMNSSEKERRAKCTYSCNFNTWRCATNIFLLFFFSLSLFYVILILIYILWNSLELLGCLKQQCKDRRFFLFYAETVMMKNEWTIEITTSLSEKEKKKKNFPIVKPRAFTLLLLSINICIYQGLFFRLPSFSRNNQFDLLRLFNNLSFIFTNDSINGFLFRFMSINISYFYYLW